MSVIVPPQDLAPNVTSRVVTIKITDLHEGGILPPTEAGTVTFALPGDLRVPADDMIIRAGTVTVELDSTGQGQVRLPCHDPDAFGDGVGSDWFLLVARSWSGRVDRIRIPTGTAPISLADIAPIMEVPAGTAQWVVTGAGAEVVTGSAWNVETMLSGGILSFRFTVPPVIKGDKGDTGNTGPTGPTGPAGTFASATATVLAAGSAPTVTLGGTSAARTVQFGIPTGPQGIQGIPGPKGDPGEVAGVSPASETQAGLIELATTAEATTGTDVVRAVTPAGLKAVADTKAPLSHTHTAADLPAASSTAVGLIETATSAEVITGTDAVRAVTPATLVTRTSTDARIGLVELATPAEVATGTDTARAVTPAGLASRVATAAATGLVELATDAEASTGTDTARALTPANLKAVLDERVGILNPIALFLGDSHTTAAGTTYHWPEQLATAMGGWTVKNYAVAGMGYTAGPTTYAVQLTNALAALTTLEKLRVRHIFVASCGNDATAAATTSAFVTAATSLFADLKTNFPLAQIHCIPAFYGSNGTNLGTARRGHLSRLVNALRDVALSAGVAFVDGSWTWTWGRADLMDSGDIHYTPAGKTWLARWVEQYLRGGTTWRDIPRTPLTAYGNAYGGYTGGGWQPLAWWMNRGVIYVNGGFTKAAAWTANAIANLPEEARPVENAQGIGCEVTWTGDIVNKQTGTGAGTLAASWPMF